MGVTRWHLKAAREVFKVEMVFFPAMGAFQNEMSLQTSVIEMKEEEEMLLKGGSEVVRANQL